MLSAAAKIAYKINFIADSLDEYLDTMEDDEVDREIQDAFEYDYYDGMREGLWYAAYAIGEDFLKELQQELIKINEVQKQSQQKIQE